MAVGGETQGSARDPGRTPATELGMGRERFPGSLGLHQGQLGARDPRHGGSCDTCQAGRKFRYDLMLW